MNNYLKTFLTLIALLPSTVFATSAFDRYGERATLAQAMMCFTIVDYESNEVDGLYNYKALVVWRKAMVREFRKTEMGSKDNWELLLLSASAKLYQAVYDDFTREYFQKTITKQQVVRKYYKALCTTIVE